MGDLLHIVLCILIGIAVLLAWDGCLVVCGVLFKKLGGMKHFYTALAAVPAIIVILFTVGFLPVDLDLTTIIICTAAALLTAALSAFIAAVKSQREPVSGKGLFWWCADGVLMEIPQRLMMQTLLFGMLKAWEVSYPDFWAVICNAAVWCCGLLIQSIVEKEPVDKKFLLESAASFIFSLGIGYAFQKTGIILIPMAGHCFERLTANYLLKRKAHNKA